MCEESYGDARERVEKNQMHDEQDWRHAYIGMEAAWKWSEEVIDALVAALEPFANLPMPDLHGVERERIHKARAALALARWKSSGK